MEPTRLTQRTEDNIQYDGPSLADFCRRWKVVELSLFGSVLRDDFRPESDVDVLVEFEAGAPWSYWDWGAMTEELTAIFGRPVDLVEKRSVANPYRRRHILANRRVLHFHAA